jgi:hypothetical protein
MKTEGQTDRDMEGTVLIVEAGIDWVMWLNYFQIVGQGRNLMKTNASF